jgi:hypothetical protein
MAKPKKYTFNTFIEAGDFLKDRDAQRVREGKPASKRLAGLGVESAGIQFAEAYPDAVVVIEATGRSSPRAPWPYQPDEGFNILKTMGNIPYSGLKLASDVGQAILSPIDTGVGLARGAAGALESGLVPSGAYTMEEGVKTPLSISPENVEVWQNIKEGLKESVSPRGLQERPLDAASNVLTTTGLLAKVGKVGARAASAAAKGQVPERIAGISERAVEAGQRIADFTGRADPGRRVTGALDKTGEIFETVEKATQRYDPANIMMRGGVEVAKKGAQVATDVATRAGVAAARYAKGKVQATKPYKAGQKIVESVNSFIENSPIGDTLRKRMAMTPEELPTELTRLREWWDKGREGGGDVGAYIFGEEARPKLTKEYGMGVTGGLLEEFLGFTFGLGRKAVRELKDVAMKGDDQTALMLETIRHADDATVHRRLANDLRGAVKQYAETQSEIHRKMRAPLQLDRVMVDVAPLRQTLLEGLPSDINIVVTDLKGTSFGPFFTDAGQGAIGKMLDAIFDESLGNNKISLQQIDNFKQLISEVLYEGGLSPEGRAAGVLREMRGATSDYIKAIADDPVAMNAKLRALREADIAKQFPGLEPKPGSIGEAIPEDLLQQFTDEAVGEFMPVGVGEYSAAMRQYFNFQDNMDDLRNNLGLERPQTRTFTTGEIDPQTGRPITEEILRQKKSDIELLRSTFQAFGDDTGLALETLHNLAKETDRPELISQAIGAIFRPTFGGGLIVRSEISQAGRDVGRIAAAGTMNAVTSMIALPFTLAIFSPKYGGQLYAAALAPDTAKFLSGPYQQAKTYGKRGIDYVKLNAPQQYQRAKRRVADEKQKRAENVTDAEVMDDLKNMEKVAGELAKLDQTQITALRDFLRYGTAEQRTRGAGQRREERQNLLQQLGRLPQTPSVSPGGLTPQAR